MTDVSQAARHAASQILNWIVSDEPCTNEREFLEQAFARFEHQIHQRLISDIGAVRDMLTFVEATPDTKTILQTQIMALTEMMAGGGSHPKEARWSAQEK